MAKPTHVNSDDSSTYELDQSDHAWIFDEGHYFSGNNYSIHQASAFTNDTITVNARVLSTATSGAGIYFQGSNSNIVVSDLGVVSGNIGIYTTGAGMTVENDGVVIAQGFAPAIYINGGANGHVINNGSLIGVGGISMDSDDGVVENNGHILGLSAGIDLIGNNVSATLGTESVITAKANGVWVESLAGEKSMVTNSGLIGMAGLQAFVGGAGNDTLINHGTIRGNLNLGDGNDVFNNIDGKFAGSVDGGMGDDTYIVDSAKTVIADANDSGNDTVKSTVSFSLAAPTLMNGQIENLVLLGTKNLHATGNALNNEITGNAGNNVIDAGAGMDEIKGGKGDDTFIFATGHETDSITDFGHGADKIDLSGCADIHGFKDLMKNHVSEDKGNIYIDSGMTDELILQHTSKVDLHASQFIF